MNLGPFQSNVEVLQGGAHVLLNGTGRRCRGLRRRGHGLGNGVVCGLDRG